MDAIWGNLIANVVIPETFRFIQGYVERNNGRWPTEAETISGLSHLSNVSVAEGEAFLNRPKKTTKKRKPKKPAVK